MFLNLKPVEVRCKYDEVVNKCLKSFTTAAIIMTPRTFDDMRKPKDTTNMAIGFFSLSICIDYLKESADRLWKWSNIIDNYLVEFNGSWKYYAASRRLEFIKENGGDEEDYDENGEIITEGLPDDAYSCYTVMDDLFDAMSRDVVQDTRQEDVHQIISVICADASLDMRKIFGKPINTYTFDDEGHIKKMSQEEQDLSLVEKQVQADDFSSLVIILFRGIWYLCQLLKERAKKHVYEDNVEFLKEIRQHVEDIKNANIDALFFQQAWKATIDYLECEHPLEEDDESPITEV